MFIARYCQSIATVGITQLANGCNSAATLNPDVTPIPAVTPALWPSLHVCGSITQHNGIGWRHTQRFANSKYLIRRRFGCHTGIIGTCDSAYQMSDTEMRKGS
jgi:hypothetical protein